MNSRRSFLKEGALASLVSGYVIFQNSSDPCGKKTPIEDLNVVGPKIGYTPHIGALVSMMNWMRRTILRPVQGMSVAELDYIHDADSNSIGAMLLHLAATERFYQLNTFENRRWGDWPAKDEETFGVAMSLGDAGRARIKGNSLDFYLDKLEEVRDYSLTELQKRDDDWFLMTDRSWGWGPTNNYCKWFHVVEHESNHNGQIKWISSRIDL